MRAKVNRLCARTKTGKLQVSEDIHKMWLQKGRVRDDLIQLMATADGNREACTSGNLYLVLVMPFCSYG